MLEEIISQSPTQWGALISGILYVVLAAREKPFCWYFGILSCSLIAWDDFNTFRLYADGVLQVMYVGLGFWGLYQWKFGKLGSGRLAIHELPPVWHVVAVSICALLSWPIYMLLARYTDAAYGYLDTLTTVLSLLATWMLSRKVLSNWLYWIVIDIVYVGLFWRTGGSLVAVLYVVFVVVAVYGYFRWLKLSRDPLTIKSRSK